jgi:hypothetical protein
VSGLEHATSAQSRGELIMTGFLGAVAKRGSNVTAVEIEVYQTIRLRSETPLDMAIQVVRGPDRYTGQICVVGIVDRTNLDA